jgi:hypothetical protein
VDYTAIALMMEAANTSETSANFYQTTRRNNPEDSHHHTRRRENLKSHKHVQSFMEPKAHYRVHKSPQVRRPG